MDVNKFRGLVSRCRRHGHAPEAVCAQCLPLLAQTVELYRGDFMAGFSLAGSAEYDDWQALQREWLRRELAGFLRRASGHFGEAGELAAAVDHGRRWLALDPLHEPAHRQLLRLYALSGQRTEALRQYRQCVELLDSELAARREDETTALHTAIQSEAPCYRGGQPSLAARHWPSHDKWRYNTRVPKSDCSAVARLTCEFGG